METKFVRLPATMLADHAFASGMMHALKLLEEEVDHQKLQGMTLAKALIKAESATRQAESQRKGLILAQKQGIDSSGNLNLIIGNYGAYMVCSSDDDDSILELAESELKSLFDDASRYRKWVYLIENDAGKVASKIASCIRKNDYDKALDAL